MVNSGISPTVNLQCFGFDCLNMDPGILELIHSQGTFILSLDGCVLRALDLAVRRNILTIVDAAKAAQVLSDHSGWV